MQADVEMGRQVEWESKAEITLGEDFCRAGRWMGCERSTLVASLAPTGCTAKAGTMTKIRSPGKGTDLGC